MMLDVLKTVIAPMVTPVDFDQLDAAHSLMDQMQYPYYEAPFYELLALFDQKDPATFVDEVYQTTKDLLVDAAQDHQITLDKEVTLPDVTGLVATLIAIDAYDDPAYLVDAASQDIPAQEALAQILAAVGSRSPEDWLPLFWSVDDSLISKIKEQSQDRLDNLSEPQDVQDDGYNAHRAANFKVFFEVIGAPPEFIARQYLKEGGRIGMQFQDYLAQLNDAFWNFEHEDIAKNLTAFAIISSDGYQDIKRIIELNLSEYIVDAEKIIVILASVTQWLIKLNTRLTTNTKVTEVK